MANNSNNNNNVMSEAKKFPAFYETLRFKAVFTKFRQLSLPNADKPTVGHGILSL